MSQLQNPLRTTDENPTFDSQGPFALLANVLGMEHIDRGAALAQACKRGLPAAETLTLSLQGAGAVDVLRAERRRGNSSVVITSDATADGAYGIFRELAGKLAEHVERYVQVLNRVENADIDPFDVVTCVSYIYRDGNNYKQAGKAYFSGPTSRDSVNAFLSMLDSSDGSPSMIPGQIGLDDLQSQFLNEWDDDSDHPFHEITSIELIDFNEMESRDAALTSEQSFDDFVCAMFHTLGEFGGWDQAYRPDFAQQSALAETAAWPGGD